MCIFENSDTLVRISPPHAPHLLSPTRNLHSPPNSLPMVDIHFREQVVTIPGAGFGPGGEGFIRLSAFASRESCIEAVKRLREVLA